MDAKNRKASRCNNKAATLRLLHLLPPSPIYRIQIFLRLVFNCPNVRHGEVAPFVVSAEHLPVEIRKQSTLNLSNSNIH